MTRFVPVAAAFALIVLSGVVHGLRTDRWQARPQDLAAAAARLATVAQTVGDWEGESVAVDKKSIVRAGLTGSLMRRYVHRRTGQEVSVFIGSGRPGRVAVHTPDVCYAGAGFRASGEPVKQTLGAGAAAAEFWMTNFVQPGAAAPVQLRLYWAWSADGAWQAPDNARTAFARCPVLYKMYVFRPLSRPDEPLEQDACTEFLKVLVPELQEKLFAVR
jgi:hypothetical protein